MIRLFVGLDIPETVRTQLAGLCHGLPRARWISPENFHITVRFIGEVDEGRAEDIDDVLAGVEIPAFEAGLAGVGAFGREHQAHTLWARVAAGAPVAALHDKVDRALQRVGLEPDRRKFLPHVTLARLKATPVERVEHFKAAHAMFRTDPFLVDRFVLFSSLLSKSGAIYRAEAEYPLRAA